MPAPRSRLVPTSGNGALARSLEELRRTLGLPEEFPPEVLTEAEDAARRVPTDPDAAGVADLRHLEFVTIDPAGSTDLDQAMHFARTSTGVILRYAIADVPAFVRPGGAIDAEARGRGQTLYAPDGRIPLHPPVLGDDAASLLPHADRRAFVWEFALDDDAEPTATTVIRAVIRSRRQWSYVDAQAALDDGTASETLRLLQWFGPLRAERERERGGASLNVAETRVTEVDGGYRLDREVPMPIEDWNAHVSLLTGMAAADIMLAGGVGILRTMPQADPTDVAAFRAQTLALGVPWAEDRTYGDYLRELDRDDPAALAILDAATSLFRGATYVAFDGTPPADTIQAAIAAPYAHTTAPLRRLVDRWSLVICEALSAGREVPDWARSSLSDLPGLMADGDRRANQLARAAIDRVETAVLLPRLGEVFSGIVVRQRSAGGRVQLTGPPVTADVPGLAAEAGSTVHVRLDGADVDTGELTLSPVDPLR